LLALCTVQVPTDVAIVVINNVCIDYFSILVNAIANQWLEKPFHGTSPEVKSKGLSPQIPCQGDTFCILML